MTRKSNILAALMFVVDFFSALFKELKKMNVTEEMIFDAMKSKDGIIPKMAEKIAEIMASVKNNVLHVLASISLKDRIARGKYDWVNSDITEDHFSVDTPADYDAEYKLFHFNRSISSDDAIKEMNKEGFRPATLAELLVLGETQPELQRQFPIFALGSIWRSSRGDRSVPALYLRDDKRKLSLDWFGYDWGDDYRFLAVRK